VVYPEATRGPTHLHVVRAVVSAPADAGPGVFELEQPLPLDLSHIQHGVRVCWNQAGALGVHGANVARGNRQQRLAVEQSIAEMLILGIITVLCSTRGKAWERVHRFARRWWSLLTKAQPISTFKIMSCDLTDFNLAP
jgi:hypothetical protein